MKKIWIIGLCILLAVLCGCSTVRTVYVYPELPEYEVVFPEKPTLETIDVEVPVEVTVNTIRLITYSQQLEVTLHRFSDF
jgi:uncharacterized protein YcfL